MLELGRDGGPMKTLPSPPNRTGSCLALALALLPTPGLLLQAQGPAFEGTSSSTVPLQRMLDRQHLAPQDTFLGFIQEARVAIESGRWTAAQRALDRALAHDAGRPETYLWYGRLQVAQSNFPLAEGAYRKAVQVDAEYVNGWHHLAELLRVNGDRKGARQAAETGANLAGVRDWPVLVLWAEILQDEEDWPGARVAYSRAVNALHTLQTRVQQQIHAARTQQSIVEIIHETDYINTISGQTIEVPALRFETETGVADPRLQRFHRAIEQALVELRHRIDLLPTP